MGYKYFAVKREDRVAVCTINNPPMNLMNADMVAELLKLADELETDPEVRSVVFTGGVEGIFIMHYDVSELSEGAQALQQIPPAVMALFGPPKELHDTHKAYNKLQFMPKPVIAAINGTATGGGCEMALACDFRFMARVGVIGLPEATVGILPGAGGTQRMTRLIGPAKALEMMLQGKVIDADEAEAIGLIHKALDPDELMPHSLKFARNLAEYSPLSLALIKKCIHEGGQLPLLEGLKLEQDCFWQTMRSEDARRLMKEYLEGGIV